MKTKIIQKVSETKEQIKNIFKTVNNKESKQDIFSYKRDLNGKKVVCKIREV